MTHAKSSRNLKLEWLRLQRRRIRSLLVLGKAVPSSANHRSKGDENSSSRVGFTLWLIRVLYVIINDFCHQRFSRELLFVHEGKKVLMIWRLGSSLMPWGSVLWELFGSSKVQILQTSKGNTGLRRDDPSQKWSPINTSVLIINVESLAWRSLSVVRETHGKRKGLNEMRKSESLWLESVMCNLNSHDPSKGRASTSVRPLGARIHIFVPREMAKLPCGCCSFSALPWRNKKQMYRHNRDGISLIHSPTEVLLLIQWITSNWGAGIFCFMQNIKLFFSAPLCPPYYLWTGSRCFFNEPPGGVSNNFFNWKIVCFP